MQWSISNHFGASPIPGPNTQTGVNEASLEVGKTTDTIENLTTNRDGFNDSSFTAALQAIRDLESYTPVSETFSYTAPTLSSVTASNPAEFTAINKNEYINLKANGIIPNNKLHTPRITGLNVSTNGANAYTIDKLQEIPTFNSILSTYSAPAALPDNLINADLTGLNTDFTPFNNYITVNTNIAAPTLNANTNIQTSYSAFPTIPNINFTDINTDALLTDLINSINSNLANISLLLDGVLLNQATSNKYVKDMKATFDGAMINEFDTIGIHTEFNIAQASSNMSASTWARRGFSQIDITANTANLHDQNTLVQMGEHNELTLSRHVSTTNMRRSFMELYIDKELDIQYKTKVQDPIARLDIIIADAYASLYDNLNSTLTNFFNGQVALYKLEASKYLLSLKKASVQLKQWKNGVNIKIANSKLNSMTADKYNSLQQAKVLNADLYENKIVELQSELSAYESNIKTYIAKSELARAKITAYEATCTNYSASLEDYRNAMQVYKTKNKVVEAKNKMAASEAMNSTAAIDKAASKNDLAVTEMQYEVERLKAETLRFSSTLQESKLENAIESTRITADANKSIADLEVWRSKLTKLEIDNDFLSSYANTAASYFSRASQSATRATSNALNANTAVAKASDLLQSSASSSASTLATGAFSVVNLQGNLSGGARLTAGHSNSLGYAISSAKSMSKNESYNSSYSNP